ALAERGQLRGVAARRRDLPQGRAATIGRERDHAVFAARAAAVVEDRAQRDRPPVVGTFFSFPSAKYPIHRPSGAEKALSAPSVLLMGTARNSSRRRT